SFLKNGHEIYANVAKLGIFNQKLLGTLAAGAIITILTFMTRKEGNVELLKTLANYLNNYLLVLFFATLNTGLHYIQTYAIHEDFEHKLEALEKDVFSPTSKPKARSREKMVNALNAIMIAIHVAAVGLFFISSFFLLGQVAQKL